MEKIPVSVGILTRNSAATLSRALESVKECADLIVCDGGSGDDTRGIALRYGARIIEQAPEYKNADGSLKDYAGARNQCLDAARYDWFFYLDSDEEASPELMAEIRLIASSPSSRHLVYALSPRIVLDGRQIEHSSNYPGWQKRFFNVKSGAHFRKAVHERIDFDVGKYSVGKLSGHWRYFLTSAEDRTKEEKYARMDAALYGTRESRRYFTLMLAKLAVVIKIAIKAIGNTVFFGRQAMPLPLEWRRIRYQLALMRLMTRMYRGQSL